MVFRRGVHRLWLEHKFRFLDSKWEEIHLGAFMILVNLCLLMQRTSKPLSSNARNENVNLFNAGLGLSDISRNTRVTKGAVHKIVWHHSVHTMTQPFSCGGKDPWQRMTSLKYRKHRHISRTPRLEAQDLEKNICRKFIAESYWLKWSPF